MGRGIVMMKGDAGLWTSGTYSMQHLGKVLMYIPICGHSAPFLQWNSWLCPVLAMYEATICLLVLLYRLNFRGGVSPGKSQTDDLAFVSGSN